MKRIPVTKASYKKISAATPTNGKVTVTAKSGPVDKSKMRQATALGIFGANFSRPTMLGSASSFYNNSYMGAGSTGYGDIPQYFALLNEQNGGVLYYPVTLKEKYEFYRYFYRHDAYVHGAVNLHTDLPMSKLILRMPKMKDKEKRKKILKKYETMVQDIHLFNKLHSILFETNVIGNCFTPGNRVNTIHGLVPIEDVCEGEMVLCNNGYYNKVNTVMRRETEEFVNEITVNKLSETITVTNDHPVFVLRNGKEECVKASELTENDYVSVSFLAKSDSLVASSRKRIAPWHISNGTVACADKDASNLFIAMVSEGFPVNKKSTERGAVISCSKENLERFVKAEPPVENEDFENVKVLGNKMYYKIDKIVNKKYNGYVYNLDVDRDHTYCVEHINTHNCFAFIQYNEEKKTWDNIVILPPEEVEIESYPMSNISRVQYRPELLNSILHKYTIPNDYDSYLEYVQTLSEDDQSVLKSIDFELLKQLKENNGSLVMDTSPYTGDGNSKIGSFVFHFCEKRHEYQELGVSPLECILTPLLMKTHYEYTQLSLASRNMTPRNIVTAPGISPENLEDLREQVDNSMLSPDYSIVANYDVSWNTIGAENRLIDLQREYETIENQTFAGLGVTRELLNGDGMYSGSKISIEVLNTRYLLKRELLQRFVEENLFKPIAEENGFYEDDEDGNRTWFYPRLAFSRLTIRDNAEVFDSLFQLYQKGSIPIGTILDLFNLDEDEIDEKLKKDMFTPKDAVYNDMLRGIYSDIGSKISENTDIAKLIAENLTGPKGQKLTYKEQEEDSEGGDEYGGFGNLDSGSDDYGDYNEEETNDFDNDTGSSEMSEEEVKDVVEDVVDQDDLNEDLSNQSDEEQNKMVQEYLESIENESNEEQKDESEEEKEDSGEVKEASFKVASVK